MISGTVVKTLVPETQATRALSTAEAEYYAVVTGGSRGTRNAVDDGRPWAWTHPKCEFGPIPTLSKR